MWKSFSFPAGASFVSVIVLMVSLIVVVLTSFLLLTRQTADIDCTDEWIFTACIEYRFNKILFLLNLLQ
ncbi:hypothetical protein VNO77_24184 [Canavalia gladiata]|uniref:Uncharacterized protein n=1 Tax=Canavalia gladiata TaxID=3824 RepID=A0AAN9L5T2_CANGL